MSITEISPAVRSAALAEFTTNTSGLKKFLEAVSTAAAGVANRHADPEKIARLFIAEAGKNPILLETMGTPTGRQSVAQFFLLSTQLGLEPGSAQGLIYPTPRRSKGDWTILPVIGYRGLAALARRSGEIARLNAGVFSEWDIEHGTIEASMEPPVLHHRWRPDAPRTTAANLAGAYAVCELKDGSMVQVILTRAEIDDARSRSSTGDKSYSPWASDYPAMARKTALRRLLNGGLVPLSLESREALATADDADPSARPERVDVTTRPAPTSAAAALPAPTDDADLPLEERAAAMALELDKSVLIDRYRETFGAMPDADLDEMAMARALLSDEPPAN